MVYVAFPRPSFNRAVFRPDRLCTQKYVIDAEANKEGQACRWVSLPSNKRPTPRQACRFFLLVSLEKPQPGCPFTTLWKTLALLMVQHFALQTKLLYWDAHAFLNDLFEMWMFRVGVEARVCVYKTMWSEMPPLPPPKIQCAWSSTYKKTFIRFN